MDEIEPYLYLGGLLAISDSAYQTFNIRKVISILGSDRELAEVERFLARCPYPVDHIGILIRDDGVSPIGDHFDTITDEIKQATKDKIPTLVHCFAGVSRSATLVAAYLCNTKGYNYDQALTYLKTKRPIVDPSFGFIAKLAYRFPK